MDALTEFSNNFKQFRDMPATEEEILFSKKRIVSDLLKLGIPLGQELNNVSKNFDGLLKKIINR